MILKITTILYNPRSFIDLTKLEDPAEISSNFNQKIFIFVLKKLKLIK
jgi:hypothetical protein